jgi:hypothetical protein
MRKFVLVALLAVGCSKSPKADMEKLADKACACAADDAACGNAALAELNKFAESNKTSDPQQINEAGKRIYDCLSMSGVRPTNVTAVLEKMLK